MRAGKAGRQQLGGVFFIPDVGAALTKGFGNCLDAFIGDHRFFAGIAIEDRNGQTPMALAGNAPVGALADHLLHPLAAPFGKPLYSVRRADGVLFERVH